MKADKALSTNMLVVEMRAYVCPHSPKVLKTSYLYGMFDVTR